MAQEDFAQALTAIYSTNPCQVLPGPLWQMHQRLEGLETAIAHDAQGVNRLEAWVGEDLVIYWRRTGRQPSPLINRRLEYLHSAIIHQDFLDAPTVAGFSSFQSFYRLRAAGSADAVAPSGIRLAGMIESGEAAESIAEQLSPDEDSGVRGVQEWLNSARFTPDLWLWAIDEATQQPVGIGIAEIDPEQREAVILGVQVLPDYRLRGIGRALIHELLRRVARQVTLTTVSGPVEDRDNPGAFFRKCGFTGDDVWWFLQR